MASLEAARAAKEQLDTTLGNHPSINGLGVTRVDDGFGVKVNLSDASEELVVPSEVDGVKVQVDVVGPIKKRAATPMPSGD
jgi:hypothetical protein